MLKESAVNDKTYEDYIAEAIREIPLYCNDWTNFNPADPGMTILENLTAFQNVQLNYINQVPEKLQGRIMDMAGFKTLPSGTAKVFVEAKNQKADFELPANQTFLVDGVSFETNQQMTIRENHFTEIYGTIYENEKEEREQDYRNLLYHEVPIAFPPFGDNPESGNALYFLMEKEPDRERDLIFYLEFEDSKKDKDMDQETASLFCETAWEIYTDKGFVSITNLDETAALTKSGEVRFKWKGVKPALFKEGAHEGYCIRCRLIKAEYDCMPKLKNVYGFLIELKQKETEALCYTYANQKEVRVRNHIMDEDYILVFCKEEGENFYRYYTPSKNEDDKGRFYEKKIDGKGNHVFEFNKERHGFGPGSFPDAIKIVAYNERIMRNFEIGTIYGYDNEEMELPGKNLIRDGFCILVKTAMEKGDARYDFVRPDKTGEEDLCYSLDENNGKIVISNPGEFIESKVLVAALCSSTGENGNILAGNEFIPKGLHFPATFINPMRGKGGRKRESLEERRARFQQDMATPGTLVMASDYENIIKNIPHLLIDKIKAISDEKRNTVTVVVKTGIDEELPGLPFAYLKTIQQELEKRRLVNTKIYVSSPDYLQVDVRGTIYVKKNYSNSKEKITEEIKKLLDYVNGPQDFGTPIEYDSFYKKIQALDCVAFIHNMTLVPRNDSLGKIVNQDLVIKKSVLIYPGNIDLETLVDIENNYY